MCRFKTFLKSKPKIMKKYLYPVSSMHRYKKNLSSVQLLEWDGLLETADRACKAK